VTGAEDPTVVSPQDAHLVLPHDAHVVLPHDAHVVLPHGAAVVAVGAPGSGKSTVLDALAAAAGDPRLRFGADDVRLLAFGTRAYQGAADHVHTAARAVFAARLASGRAAASDSTNTTAVERRALLAVAARYGRPAVALLFRVPGDVLVARNAGRAPDAVVPDDVVLRMAARVALLDERRLLDEGFASVVLLGAGPHPRLTFAPPVPPPAPAPPPVEGPQPGPRRAG
jgi:predicted kinase